jgi:hypothetical protein
VSKARTWGRHFQPNTGSYRICINASGESDRNTGHGVVLHGLTIIAPCIFQPKGIVSVAAGILFNDGSLIVAVVNWLLSAPELVYVAAPACPPLALTLPLPAASVAEWHPSVISKTAQIIITAGRIPRILSLLISSFQISAWFYC